MLSVLIQSLVLATAGLLSVGSITIILLLLMSEQGVANGLAYMVGYTGGYMLIGVGLILLGTAFADASSGGSGLFWPILQIGLGALLIWLGQRNWRQPPTATAEPSRLFRIVDNITPPKALLFGALVTVINFKNLALFITAVSVVLVSSLPTLSKIGIALLDALVFCTSVIVPVLIYLLIPNRAETYLAWIKQTLDAQRRPIGIGVPLVFGFIFMARGLTGLL